MEPQRAEQSTPPTLSSEPKQPPTIRKRPFFKNNNNKQNREGPPSKRQMATFSKTPETKLSSTYPLQLQFELATQFTGVRHVTNCFYDLLSVRDSKTTSYFSALEFHYIVLLSVYYRCATVANTAKTTIILGLHDLSIALKGLLLPDAVATYVETFGRFKLSSGASVVPYFRGIHDMQHLPGFVDPVTGFRTINQIREEKELPPYGAQGDWNISIQIITNYSKALARMSKGIVDFRSVNFDELEGRAEFVSCYEVDGNTRIRCYSYDNVDQAACQLGAAFRFRHCGQPDVGVNMEPMFGAPDIEYDVTLTNHFLKSFRRIEK
jgi:hypothetical protein